MQKKLNVLFLSIFFLLVFLHSSCEKDTQIYCAECYEVSSGYEAEPFCGSVNEVDSYTEDLMSSGTDAGQSWSCSTIAE